MVTKVLGEWKRKAEKKRTSKDGNLRRIWPDVTNFEDGERGQEQGMLATSRGRGKARELMVL